MRLGVLGSTRGSSLQPVLDAAVAGSLGAEVVVIISNKKASGILERARQYQVPAVCVETNNRLQAETEIQAVLQAHQVDAVLLVGWMRILSPTFVSAWRGKIVNVHPSLLPAFAGLMNDEVHRAVLLAGCKETGCSVHQVIAEVDAGEVLVQKKCPVLPGDTVDSLKARVQALEGSALIDAIKEKLS